MRDYAAINKGELCEELHRKDAEIDRLRALLEGKIRDYALLRADNERLRAALNELWSELSYMDGSKPHRLCGIARAALAADDKDLPTAEDVRGIIPRG